MKSISKLMSLGRTVGFPSRRPGFESGLGHVGFVVDEVALGQVFSEYFGFPFKFSFHRLLHIHHHLSSGAGTIGQLVADAPSGLSLTPPQGTKKKLISQSFADSVSQSVTEWVLHRSGFSQWIHSASLKQASNTN
jgi:hypothetical protein